MKKIFDNIMAKLQNATWNGSFWSSPFGYACVVLFVVLIMAPLRLLIMVGEVSVSGANFAYHKISEKLSR